MILYVDTSALVKLYVREPDSRGTLERVGSASVVATSRVAYPEATAALARRRREGGISRAAHARSVSALDKDFPRFVVVELTEKVGVAAGDLADRRSLRGFDAIHLASALELEALTGELEAFLCFDNRLRDAARAEGLTA